MLESLPQDLSRIIAGRTAARDAVGCSQAGVYRLDGDGSPLWLKVEAAGGELPREHQVLQWLKGMASVPEVLYFGEHEGQVFLLTGNMPGEMACAAGPLDDPLPTIRLLAEGLKLLQAVDITACPLDCRLDLKLEKARISIGQGMVDMSDWEPDTLHSTPESLLSYLMEHKPAEEDLSFTHGDYCLPNIFLEGGAVSGFIDLGRAGIADRWQDIALCVRSLHHNFHTEDYDGYLFHCLGIKPNWEKIRYYVLLDELF